MNNFINTLVKLSSFYDWGLTSLIYSIYIKRTKKLSYVEEKTIKSDFKEQFIKTRSICYFMYFLVLFSLFINLYFTNFNKIFVYSIHVLLFICIFIYRVVKESKFY